MGQAKPVGGALDSAHHRLAHARGKHRRRLLIGDAKIEVGGAFFQRSDQIPLHGVHRGVRAVSEFQRERDLGRHNIESARLGANYADIADARRMLIHNFLSRLQYELGGAPQGIAALVHWFRSGMGRLSGQSGMKRTNADNGVDDADVDAA